MSEGLPSPAFILLLFNKPRPLLSSNPAPCYSSSPSPPDSKSAHTAGLFRAVYSEPSALCSPAVPRRLPVSESGYQATTFKYLPSRPQTVKSSGDQRWKEQTIQVPLPLHFDNISEFTNDPYILLSLGTPPPTCHHPCADCNLAWCNCILNMTTAKVHATVSWCGSAVKMRQRSLGQMGRLSCRPTTSKRQSVTEHSGIDSRVHILSLCHIQIMLVLQQRSHRSQ